MHPVDLIGPVVANRMKLACGRVELWVRSEVGRQATEVRRANVVEVVIELDREGSGFDDRQRLASMTNDARVRTEVAGADVTVAIPLRFASSEPKTVNHAVAKEPVVVSSVGGNARVRPVAEKAPLQLVGDCSVDREVGCADLFGNRRKVAF